MVTIILLIFSNIFMTFAWYGHLNYKEIPLWKVIFLSWGLAFFEYTLQVPANRYGHGQFSAVELKTLQEFINLVIFGIFSHFYLKETLRLNHIIGFLLLVLAVFIIFRKW
jgi:hypothetical protein